MGRIREGVRRTEKGLLDNIREQEATLDPADRPIATVMLELDAFERDVMERAHKLQENVAAKLVATRREARSA